jgi:hypothetical protein
LRRGLEDRVQALGRHRLAQLLERPRLELSHAFARQAQRLADLLERVLFLATEAVAQPQDQLLARGQHADQVTDARAHSLAVEAVVRRGRERVGDEVFEPLLGARDRRLERDRLAREQVEGLERTGIGAEFRCEFRRSRIASELAGELRAYPLAALQPVVHVRGQPDRPRVVLNRAHERLPDPPDRIGRELEATPVVELLDRADQAQIAFLDQVRERQPEVPVVLRDSDYELQVVLDEAVLLERHAVVCLVDGFDQLEQPGARHLGLGLVLLETLRPAARLLQLACEGDDLLPQFGEDHERQVGALHLLRDLGIDLRDVLGGCFAPLREQRAQALDGALDPRRDLARLLVADRFGQLRARVGQRAQGIPAFDHVLRAARDRVQGIA